MATKKTAPDKADEKRAEAVAAQSRGKTTLKDPNAEAVRVASEDAAMKQDEIRKSRRGVRGERLEQLASMQPAAVTEPDLKAKK